MLDTLTETIKQQMVTFPEIEGPILVTENSHPFSSMAYAREVLDLEAYGYVEEEYFLSGTANVYEEEGNGFNIKTSNLPYKNRLFIRKPSNPDNFSGRVYIDIYNASNGYDIEDVWRRSYQYYLENGDIYIGITSKPINVNSLKNFDYDRYHTLNWASNRTVPQPAVVNSNMSIPGTEEGLFWDMLTQLAGLVRYGNPLFLEGYSVDYLYLTGQSQSGIYLNTYVYYFHPYLRDDNQLPLFDGYLNVVGAGVMRLLNQNDEDSAPFSSRPQKVREMDIPFIFLTAQGDIDLFAPFEVDRGQLNVGHNPDNKLRHYEVASAPHTDPSSPLIPDNEEIVKTKNPAKLLDGDYDYTVNAIQLSYYVNTCLEWLHQWSSEQKTPPQSLELARDEEGTILIDEHGNGLGGLRSPYVDVPVATYHANAKSKKHPNGQAVGNVNGSMDYFDYDKLIALYGSKEEYLRQFNQSVDQQVEKLFLLPSDGKRLKLWAKNISETLFKIEKENNNGNFS